MSNNLPVINSRQLAFNALQEIEYNQAYTDIALDRVLHNQKISPRDRSLVCQLVYGVVRHKRSLNALIDNLGKKKAQQQPPKLRIILYLGLYQLRYLNQIPDSAAVNTSVELAKVNGLKKLAAVVNGLLRNYIRQTRASLGQHSEGVILSERGAEVSSAYPIEALGSPQNVDEVRWSSRVPGVSPGNVTSEVAGAFIPQSSDRPNAPDGVLKDTAAPSGRADPSGRASQAQAHNAGSHRFLVPYLYLIPACLKRFKTSCKRSQSAMRLTLT